MDTENLVSMVEVFEVLEGQRSEQLAWDILSELLAVVVRKVLTGADDFEAVLQ